MTTNTLKWTRLCAGEYVAYVGDDEDAYGSDVPHYSISRLHSAAYRDTAWYLTYPGERAADGVNGTLSEAKAAAEWHYSTTPRPLTEVLADCL